MKLNEILAGIKPVDKEMHKLAVERTSQLIMPPRAMGRLNTISEQVSAIQGTLKPVVDKRCVFVMAGDHGIVEEGVSAFPQEVTIHMIGAFVAGLATINALARHAHTRVVVADIGTKAGIAEAELKGDNRFVVRNIAKGTENFAKGPAMTREQAMQAIEAGFAIASEEIQKHNLNLIATGDMGIGNTTPSTAIGMVYTGLTVDQMTGRGSGINDESYTVKKNAIMKGLEVNSPDKADAVDVLAKVGGYEIGAIAGVILAGAYHGVTVMVDGIISTAGALIAYGLSPESKEYMIAGHCSEEPGHVKMLEYIGIQPVLNLGMRLGEGTGAVVAMNVVDAAASIMREVATFAEAGVAEAL